MSTRRTLGVVAALALGACHSAPPPRAPHVATISASTVVAARPSRPGRADVDLEPAQRFPLREEITTGRDPCGTPPAPADKDTAVRHRALLIKNGGAACRMRVPVRRPPTNEIPRI